VPCYAKLNVVPPINICIVNGDGTTCANEKLKYKIPVRGLIVKNPRVTVLMLFPSTNESVDTIAVCDRVALVGKHVAGIVTRGTTIKELVTGGTGVTVKEKLPRTFKSPSFVHLYSGIFSAPLPVGNAPPYAPIPQVSPPPIPDVGIKEEKLTQLPV